MQVKKVLSIAVVSVATAIVIVTGVFALAMLRPFGRKEQQSLPSSEEQHAVSPAGDVVLISKGSGESSFLYRKYVSTGKTIRLTGAAAGVEAEPRFSHNGRLVVYSYASSPESKSSVWIVGADGSGAHQLTGINEDALHPVFSPDDSKVFYAASTFTGHYSPIVGPARHDWEVFSRAAHLDGTTVAATPLQITRSSFYDLGSLDVAANDVTPGGVGILISTTGYPIGALLQEFHIGGASKDKIFQPHVPGEPTPGPAYGEARFIHQGMDILFLAATNTAGGNYDYNVFSMSDVTGSGIKQLTQLKGMTSDLQVLPDDRATFVNDGHAYMLDVSTKVVKPL